MSYIFALFIILGYIGVINKNAAGFIIQTAGCIGMMMLYAYVDWGVVLVNFVFALVNLIGWKKWTRGDLW